MGNSPFLDNTARQVTTAFAGCTILLTGLSVSFENWYLFAYCWAIIGGVSPLLLIWAFGKLGGLTEGGAPAGINFVELAFAGAGVATAIVSGVQNCGEAPIIISVCVGAAGLVSYASGVAIFSRVFYGLGNLIWHLVSFGHCFNLCGDGMPGFDILDLTCLKKPAI